MNEWINQSKVVPDGQKFAYQPNKFHVSVMIHIFHKKVAMLPVYGIK